MRNDQVTATEMQKRLMEHEIRQSKKVKLSDPPETKEILAESITRISDGVTKLQASGLNRKAIVVLLCDSTGFGKSTISAVIDALGELKTKYCR